MLSQHENQTHRLNVQGQVNDSVANISKPCVVTLLYWFFQPLKMCHKKTLKLLTYI